MKIIDAHIHTNFHHPELAKFAKEEKIPFSWSYLQRQLNQHNVAGAIIITSDHNNPTPGEEALLTSQRKQDQRLFPVCSIHPDYTTRADVNKVEKLLQEKALFGMKILPGYHPVYPSDQKYHAFYTLAEKYKVPVIIHTGDTFGSHHLVKYAHPLDVDEIAVRFPKTTFILAHLGNPWVRDAAELVLKNENVYADLSAFCLSHPDKHDLQRITQDLNFALNYSGRPDKFLFGTDWPLVDIGSYIDTIKKAVPHKHHQKVFFENANKIFKMGL